MQAAGLLFLEDCSLSTSGLASPSQGGLTSLAQALLWLIKENGGLPLPPPGLVLLEALGSEPLALLSLAECLVQKGKNLGPRLLRLGRGIRFPHCGGPAGAAARWAWAAR